MHRNFSSMAAFFCQIIRSLSELDESSNVAYISVTSVDKTAIVSQDLESEWMEKDLEVNQVWKNLSFNIS